MERGIIEELVGQSGELAVTVADDLLLHAQTVQLETLLQSHFVVLYHFHAI